MMNSKQRRKERRRVKRMAEKVADVLLLVAEEAKREGWSAEQIRHELRAGGHQLKLLLKEV